MNILNDFFHFSSHFPLSPSLSAVAAMELLLISHFVQKYLDYISPPVTPDLTNAKTGVPLHFLGHIPLPSLPSRPSSIVVTLAALGWIYYFVLVVTYVNFVSYMMLAGLFFFGPTILISIIQASRPPPKSLCGECGRHTDRKESSEERSERRIEWKNYKDVRTRRALVASGVLLLLICLGLFPAFYRMPLQVRRHAHSF